MDEETANLFLACMANDEGRVLEALRAGADVNATDASGRRPLQIALPGGSLGVIRSLLDGGASLDVGDQALGPKDHPAMQSPLADAAWYRRGDVARLILGKAATLGGDVEAFVNRRDSQGSAALHTAASNGDAELTRLLVAHGADVAARDLSGNTPLHVAAAGHDGGGSVAIVKLLLDAATAVGLDAAAYADAVNAQGRTALSIAQGNVNGPEIARLLDGHGGRTGHVNRLGQTDERGNGLAGR